MLLVLSQRGFTMGKNTTVLFPHYQRVSSLAPDILGAAISQAQMARSSHIRTSEILSWASSLEDPHSSP